MPSTEQFSASAPTAECHVCYEQVPSGIVDASEVLYGPGASSLRGLAEAIATYLRLDSVAANDPLTDKDIATLAVEDCLGVRLKDLTAAYRHYGQYGEQCRIEKQCGALSHIAGVDWVKHPVCLNDKHAEGTPHSFESEVQG